jgi:hypothetical protein
VTDPPFLALPDASQDAVERTCSWVRDLQRFASDGQEATPCMVVTPLGMPHRPLIREICACHGLGFVQRAPIPDWPTASIPIYTREVSDERVRVGLGFVDVWRRAVSSQLAELWLFQELPSAQTIGAVKRSIREAIPALRYRVALPQVVLRSPDQTLRLHPVHSPDADRLAFELTMLRRMVDRRAWRFEWVELPASAPLT